MRIDNLNSQRALEILSENDLTLITPVTLSWWPLKQIVSSTQLVKSSYVIEDSGTTVLELKLILTFLVLVTLTFDKMNPQQIGFIYWIRKCEDFGWKDSWDIEQKQF